MPFKMLPAVMPRLTMLMTSVSARTAQILLTVSGFAASSRIGLPVVSEALVEGDGFSFTVEMPTLYTLRAGDFMFMDDG